MKNKKKGLLSVLAALLLGVVGYVFGAFNVVSDTALLGGGNFPDRCEFYDQAASRSLADVVKAGAGKLYSYRVVSTATNLRYFQLHNDATDALNTGGIVYSMPLDTTIASATPKVIEERFVVPMDFTTGIGFSIGNAFGSFTSGSDQGVRNSYFVTLCWI